MSDRSDKPISADRRGFFRQILVSAIEGIEKVGKDMQDRVSNATNTYEHTDYSDYNDFNWDWNEDTEAFGPAWPPPLGPPIPVGLRPELRKLAAELDPHHPYNEVLNAEYHDHLEDDDGADHDFEADHAEAGVAEVQDTETDENVDSEAAGPIERPAEG